jgi:hypothetical protein
LRSKFFEANQFHPKAMLARNPFTAVCMSNHAAIAGNAKNRFSKARRRDMKSIAALKSAVMF